MTKVKRETITILYGSDYAIIKAKMTSDFKVLINILRGICDSSVATSTLAVVMSAMSEIARGKTTVYDAESGTVESIISVHVDTADIIITFTGFSIKSENM